MKSARKGKQNLEGSDKMSDDQNNRSKLAFFASLDVTSASAVGVENLLRPWEEVTAKHSIEPLRRAIPSTGWAAGTILSVTNDTLAQSNGSQSRYGIREKECTRFSRQEQTPREDDSELWSLSSIGPSTTTAVEGLLLNPINEVVAFTEDYIISPRGDVISHTGEVISHLTSATLGTNSKVADDEGDGDGNENPLQPSVEQLVIDIRPRCDREEVELVACSCDEAIESYGHSDSLLLGDPHGVEDQMLPMNLKIIRGKELPFVNCRIRVSVLNENGVIDQVLGTTPWSKNYKTNPVWGGAACFWSLIGKPSTQILFTLEDEDTEGGEKSEKKDNETTISPQSFIFAKVDAMNLMVVRHPNLWIKLQDNGPAKINDCGFVRVRLSQPKQATLHQQENCRRLTPGPAFPRMESYAIRKKLMFSCSPVILNVYDVSNDSRVETINNTVKTMGYGGIFHAAIQIHGKEYSFGGTRDRNSKVSGVFCSPPKRCPMHHYRESVYLGDCELTMRQVSHILDDLRPQWLASSYNLFRKNCAFFSRELAIELGVGDIPDWVFSLASTAEFIEPYAVKLNNYLIGRIKASPHAKGTFKSWENARTPYDAERIAVVLDEDGSLEAQEVATSTQESLLDHAMAARIQRSFRAASARNLGIPGSIGSDVR